VGKETVLTGGHHPIISMVLTGLKVVDRLRGMFERFTDRARHVVVLAQEEARFLNHNYIGTEHILLGLLGEPDSIGGKVLAGFGITRDGAREEVTAKVGRGKGRPSGRIPFTPRAKKTLELSLREALHLKHNYISTEHILLGLIRESEGVAAQILREHADLLEIRVAVLDAVSATDPGEAGRGGEAAEGTEETNAVLRWLRQRLTWGGTSVPFRPAAQTAESAARGTPAAEAALAQAASLAGAMPVGSHHLLLAALADSNSAASATLASLGVDLDELREKLRSAKVAGTTDEQPEQAGRRQMTIQVSDEVLHIVLTDPVIVEAGKEALRAVNATAAAASAAVTPETGAAEAGAAEAGAESSGGEPEGKSATATVIRGDHPAAAGLANVWLELRKTLATLADTNPPSLPRKQIKVARQLKYLDRLRRELGEADEPGEPDEADEAGS
jgi:ATP-dependent Clp protease ATP-binding subunit ClpA